MAAQGLSVFFLKTKPDSLKAAETFLRNRNWRIGSGTNLREALAFLLQKKPDLILIPSDHPNKKVKVLPKILAQAFAGIKIIVYCESSAGNAIAALHEMGAEYSLFPPVSGPAIERIVLKIQKDEERKKREAEERKAMGLSETDETADTIRLKGENMSDDQRNSSFEQARAALNQLISGEGDDPNSILGKGDNPSGQAGSAGSGLNNGESFASWDERTRTESRDGSSGGSSGSGMAYSGNMGNAPTGQGGSGIGYMGNMGQNGDPGSGGAGGGSGIGYMGGGMNGPAGSNSAGGGSGGPGGGIGYMGGMSGPGSMGQMGGSGFGTPNADGSGITPFPDGDGNGGPGGYADGFDANGNPIAPDDPNYPGASRRNKSAPIFEHGPMAPKKKKTPRYKGGGPSGKSEIESIIVRGTQQALDETVTHVEGSDDDDSYVEIEKASQCACIIVESERFSGYLVAAMGKDRKIDQSFMAMIKERLFSFLRAHGEVLKSEEAMSIKIQEIEFEDWALEQADFLRKSIHEGDEVAMAFFPTKDTSAKLEESVAENMLKMDISELKEDTAIEFDLYLYMPDNNKFLLYTQEGRPIYGDQKKRLTDRGITHMHLRKENAGNVKKYRAQNYLNEKIEAFRQAQKLKAQ